jgi:hypothetical protein
MSGKFDPKYVEYIEYRIHVLEDVVELLEDMLGFDKTYLHKVDFDELDDELSDMADKIVAIRVLQRLLEEDREDLKEELEKCAEEAST